MISFKEMMRLAFETATGTLWFRYLKWGIILAILSFIGYKGYDFYSSYNKQKETITNLNKTIKDNEKRIDYLQSENERLDKELKITKESQDITNTITGEIIETQDKSKTSLTDISESRKKQEEIIKETKTILVKKPAATKKDKPTTEVKQIADNEVNAEISNVRISSLWKSYCSSNRPRVEDVDTCSNILKTT